MLESRGSATGDAKAGPTSDGVLVFELVPGSKGTPAPCAVPRPSDGPGRLSLPAPPRGTHDGESPQAGGMSTLLRPGQIFAGRYRVEGFLAKGGFGAVYAAEQIETEVRVALK